METLLLLAVEIQCLHLFQTTPWVFNATLQALFMYRIFRPLLKLAPDRSELASILGFSDLLFSIYQVSDHILQDASMIKVGKFNLCIESQGTCK